MQYSLIWEKTLILFMNSFFFFAKTNIDELFLLRIFKLFFPLVPDSILYI